MAAVGTKRASGPARKVGYAIGVGANALLLYAVENLASWDTLRFVTDDFDRVSSIISLALLASLIANLAYLYNDDRWFKSLGSIVTTAIGVVASVRVWQVFPFDFSGYDVDWSAAIRALLVLSMVGGGIGIVAELVRLIRGHGT